MMISNFFTGLHICAGVGVLNSTYSIPVLDCYLSCRPRKCRKAKSGPMRFKNTHNNDDYLNARSENFKMVNIDYVPMVSRLLHLWPGGLQQIATIGQREI